MRTPPPSRSSSPIKNRPSSSTLEKQKTKGIPSEDFFQATENPNEKKISNTNHRDTLGKPLHEGEMYTGMLTFTSNNQQTFIKTTSLKDAQRLMSALLPKSSPTLQQPKTSSTAIPGIEEVE